MPTLGAFIRRRRTELGLTQEVLADLIGENTRQADVSRLENDRVLLPRRARLDAIAQALQVSPGELLARSGWGGGEVLDEEATGNDLAARMSDLQEQMEDDSKDENATREVISAALPAISDTVGQVHDLVHQAVDLLDQTQAQVESLNEGSTEKKV